MDSKKHCFEANILGLNSSSVSITNEGSCEKLLLSTKNHMHYFIIIMLLNRRNAYLTSCEIKLSSKHINASKKWQLYSNMMTKTTH